MSDFVETYLRESAGIIAAMDRAKISDLARGLAAAVWHLLASHPDLTEVQAKWASVK